MTSRTKGSTSSLDSFLEARRISALQVPWWVPAHFYFVYSKRDRCTLYTNYFEYFRVLVQWLGPLSSPSKEELASYNYIPPELCSSYELQQVSLILGVPTYCLAGWLVEHRVRMLEILNA